MLPSYRQRAAFGSLENYMVDERGACPLEWELPRTSCDSDAIFRLETSTGKVTGYYLPDGALASDKDILEDANRWAQSFANDVRTLHTQNHDHNCSATCIKYAKEQQKDPLASHKVPPCRFYFFHVVVIEVEEEGRTVTKRFLRRGKELVDRAFVATTNERNEFGRAVVERTHPFTSSSSDLTQAAGRSNADVQYVDRAVPTDLQHVYGQGLQGVDEEAAIERQEIPAERSRILSGVTIDTRAKQTLMLSLKAAAKAGFVTDFYMTKYAAKAQQVLSSALAPLIQGLRRFELEEAEEGEKPERERAIAKLRRLMFSANRCHWFSATELALYILTGGHCISTHQDQVMFTARTHYMMQQCKRTLNGETAAGAPYAHGSSKELQADIFVCTKHREALDPSDPANSIENTDCEKDRFGSLANFIAACGSVRSFVERFATELLPELCGRSQTGSLQRI